MPAILHSLHRAILTSPSPLPDTIFALNVNDIPRPNTWSFARSDDDLSPSTPWLMPHYHSWSWAMPTLGPLDEVLSKIEQMEKQLSWDKKIDKAVWRGTKLQNPDWSPGLRRSLLDTWKEKQWADIEATERGLDNALKGEEFCKYRYIIYAEVGTIQSWYFLPVLASYSILLVTHYNSICIISFFAIAHFHRANHIQAVSLSTKLAPP